MNKIHYLIPLILGLALGSVAILPGLAQQATFGSPGTEMKWNAVPSGVSQGNTSGIENMTMLSENIPTANVTGDSGCDPWDSCS